MTLALVTGTATEVGKTWWARATLDLLRADGVTVAARKPAQSYAPDEIGATDAELLGAGSGEAPATVCPAHRWYPVPMAPPMAADVLGLPPYTIADLVAEMAPVDGATVTLVEGAGGPRSPIATDGDCVNLGRALDVDTVVLVAPAGLGTINAVRVSAAPFAAAPAGPAPRLLVALNRFDGDDDLHRRNHGWLASEGFQLVLEPAELAAALTGPRIS